MLLENLTIQRLLVHEVFQRQDERRIVPPAYAEKLEQLSPEALGAFKIRVTEALSAKAKSLEMDIINAGADSHIADAAFLLDRDDNDFVVESRRVPDRLAKAQMGRGIPGGLVIVFDGSVGAPPRRLLGVIKAEVQSGFRRRRDAEAVITEFLNNVFLTPATRLYKIGIMVEVEQAKKLPQGWKAFVFDNNISSSHREAAAQYFYESFLGCNLKADGAYETGKFFDLTRDFIKSTSLPQENKRDLSDALYTFVKTEQAKTFTSDEFAEKYLPLDLRDAYGTFLAGKRFPSRAIVRDTSLMTARLRRRRFRFGSDIEFSASPDALHDKRASIQALPAAQLGGEEEAKWTQIIIRQPLTDER